MVVVAATAAAVFNRYLVVVMVVVAKDRARGRLVYLLVTTAFPVLWALPYSSQVEAQSCVWMFW